MITKKEKAILLALYSQLPGGNYVPQSYAEEIRNRLPENSPIHDPDNLGYKLIDTIGLELGKVEAWLFRNSDSRFLERASGAYLDQYGLWFGLSRQTGMSSTDYYNQITGFRGSDITITGLKKAISSILQISRDEIIITNTYPNYATVGGVVSANHFTGTPKTFSGYTNVISKNMTIILPTGSDPNGILPGLISNLTVPGITITILEV